MASDTKVREAECDVCGTKLPVRRGGPRSELRLCDECSLDFGKSKVAGCC